MKKKSISILFVLITAAVLLLCSAAEAKPKNSLVNKNLSCKTLRVMARVYMSHGQFNKAASYGQQALSLAQQRNESDEELCLCLIDMAYIHNEQGHYEKAEELCTLGLKLQKKVYYETHPYVAYTLRTLSSIYMHQGKMKEAAECLNQAMEIMYENHPSDNQIVAPFQVDFAKLCVAEGKLTEAEEYYDKAIAVIKECYGAYNLYTATVMASIAELYTLQGKFNEAEEILKKSQPILEKVYGQDHYFNAGIWLTKAKILQAKGRISEAEILFEKARNAVEKTGNIIEVAKLEQRIEKIRSAKADAVTFEPLAGLTEAAI